MDARSWYENREPTTENPFGPDSPTKFVKYIQYSPHSIGKSDSKLPFLAVASILGPAPGHVVEISNQTDLQAQSTVTKGALSPRFPRAGRYLGAINQQQLEMLLAEFIDAFHAGDINRFMSLFAREVRVEDMQGWQAVRKDYHELFQSTHQRSLSFNNIHWHEDKQGSVWGDIEFTLQLLSKLDEQKRSFSGVLRLHAIQSEQHLLINELYFAYNTPAE